MKAYRFTDTQTPLQLQDIAKPVPGQGQVLIQVKAAGLCHSDCHILEDASYGLIRQRPLTLGHEVAGTIVELGSDVSDFAVGDRVARVIATHPLVDPDRYNVVGIGYNGGYAEFTVVRQEHISRIPEGVSFALGAVATDSIATAYHAVVAEGRGEASHTVAIIELGGLGLAAVQIAGLKGATVYGVDRDTSKFEAARSFGAVRCAASLDDIADVSFDIVYDFAGAGVTTTMAAKRTKLGGKVVLVGLAATKMTLETHDFITRSIALQGSAGASKAELEGVLQLVAQGRITQLVTEIPFRDVPAGLEELETGRVDGRLWADPSKALS